MNLTTHLIKLSSHNDPIISRAVYASRYEIGPEKTARKLGPALALHHGDFTPENDRRHYTLADIFDSVYTSGLFFGGNYMIGQIDDITDTYFIVDDD